MRVPADDQLCTCGWNGTNALKHLGKRGLDASYQMEGLRLNTRDNEAKDARGLDEAAGLGTDGATQLRKY